jgi:16S rRNA (uracil1498-N3)-methyltransferase
MARRRFFVDTVHRGQAQINGPDAHHLTRVLRVETGQKFEISDNQNVYLAEVHTARKDLVVFEIIEQLEVPAPFPHVHLLAALIKFEHFEWMIEKTTELGVERITPVETDRSEKGLAQAAAKRLARWNRIAREACEQSRRARLPEIAAAGSLDAALRAPENYRYALEEAEARPILSTLPATRRPEDQLALLVGPEGGWTERERTTIQAAGWTAVSLGRNILRAETAAIAALSILTAAWDSVS